MNVARSGSVSSTPGAEPVRHEERVARHLRRFSLLAASATLIAGLTGLAAGCIHGCTIGWSNSGSSRTTAVFGIERTGRGQYRVQRNPTTPSQRQTGDTQSIDVEVQFRVDVLIPDWMDSRTFSYRLERRFGSDQAPRTCWDIEIVLITDPFAKNRARGKPVPEFAREESIELITALCEELGIAHLADAESVSTIINGTGVYPVQLTGWSSSRGCAISIPLTVLLAGTLSFVTLVVCRAVWSVHTEGHRRRMEKGICAWCRHPIVDNLCTECGTTFYNASRINE